MEAIVASFNIVSQDLNTDAHKKDGSPHVNRYLYRDSAHREHKANGQII